MFHSSKEALGYNLQAGYLPASLEYELPATLTSVAALAYRDLIHDDKITPQVLV